MFYTDAFDWAHSLFSEASLGDTRRTKRLVQIAANSARKLGKSLVKSCNKPAEIEASYRFMRNEAIDVKAIEDAGFSVTARHAEQFNEMLAIEDTTSLNYSHASVRDELGHITASKQARGLQAHSVLLYATEEQQVVGLIEQHRWSRDIKRYGQSNRSANQTPYLEKESYKWERASRRVSERLSQKAMSRVIFVCDREADIIEYIHYKLAHNQRFIVRSSKSRHIEEATDKLHNFGYRLESAGERELLVAQKGGRKARKAKMAISFATVHIKAPANKPGESVPLSYVLCREVDGEACWHLLTCESITGVKQAQKIVDHYERRWLIEDYHKAWKSSGTQVEDLRMQSASNLERMTVIKAFIAVRVMQLRLFGNKVSPRCKDSCETLLSPTAWKLLWLKREERRVPKKPPTIEWAYINIAKLAGWYDSKRTGVVGWKTLWEGWLLLESILDGYFLAKSLESDL